MNSKHIKLNIFQSLILWVPSKTIYPLNNCIIQKINDSMAAPQSCSAELEYALSKMWVKSLCSNCSNKTKPPFCIISVWFSSKWARKWLFLNHCKTFKYVHDSCIHGVQKRQTFCQGLFHVFIFPPGNCTLEQLVMEKKQQHMASWA